MSSRPRIYAAILTAVILTCLTGCSVTRNLPPDAYMLTGNNIETDKSTPRDERITAGEFDRYIRQNPSKKLLGTDLPVWLYNQADTSKHNFWNNFLRRLGSPPVILDTQQTAISTRNLKLYMDSRGFYRSRSSYDIRYKRNQKAIVTYSVKQGPPYRIHSINYDYQDTFLERVIQLDTASTLVRVGDIFDLEVLNQERRRITELLKDRGYYDFSINNINYIADTLANDCMVDLVMVIRQHLAGYDTDGDPIYENNAVYHLDNIYVYPDYNATLAATDPEYLRSMDTTYYYGLNIIHNGRLKIRPKTLRQAIPIYPDYLYSDQDRQRTSSNIQRLDYFKNASVTFSEPDSSEDKYITYITDSTESSPIQTQEKPLNCEIFCTPAMRQGYALEFEATTSSAFYALRPTVSYLNRNLFRGAELLNISLWGGYEFNKDEEPVKNSYEVGVSASITFPRFLFFFPIDRAGKLYRPLTRIEVSNNMQRKSKYHRNITGVNIGYSWSNGRKTTYTVRPLDFNLVDVGFIDENFLCSIQNSYLRASYRSQYIAAISGTYVFSNQQTSRGNSIIVRVNAETAGNLTDALAHWWSHPVTEQVTEDDCGQTNSRHETFYKIFNIRYSQYFRVDANISNTVSTGYNTAIAYRFYGGIGVPYGNSTTLPMDRMFYVGGSNSMRGWPVRALGPGASPDGRTTGFKNQLGNLRLEANFEFRFPIWKSLLGALFFDAGNVWLTGIPGAEQDEIFRFDSFYKELGLDMGLGIRYDLGLVVVRLDWGLRVHDPSLPAGERWITHFKWHNTALNFGIGYPF